MSFSLNWGTDQFSMVMSMVMSCASCVSVVEKCRQMVAYVEVAGLEITAVQVQINLKTWKVCCSKLYFDLTLLVNEPEPV